jgi:16S rRNA (guanine527-N7)-methyltransferase
MGISMSDSKLADLARMIDEWPGLVAGSARDLVDDSLVLLGFVPDTGRLVDVGSGGGLPGLALKIARPSLDVTLVESDQAKAAFLVGAAARLALKQVEVLARPAEEVGQDPRYRGTFDVAVARALAPLPVLVELCLPLVRVGGTLLAQKTQNEDASLAERAIALLGGALESVSDAPSVARRSGTVVVIHKAATTPDAYPRRPGVPRRKPL